jgi:uncharacterized protein with beta-barrel porin domain
MSISLKKILLAGTALVAMNYATQAHAVACDVQAAGPGTVTVNGNCVTVDHDPASINAINFLTADTANVGDDVNITGSITTIADEDGTLNLLGTTTVSKAVGAAGLALFEIDAGVSGETDTFSKTVNATDTSFSGDGTINFNGDVTGDVNFQGFDGILNLGPGASIDGGITSGGEAPPHGTLNLLGGDQTITGDVAWWGDTSLDGITAGVAGGDANFDGQVWADDFTIVGTGAVTFEDNADFSNLNFAGNGKVTMRWGGGDFNFDGNIQSTDGDGTGNLVITGGPGDFLDVNGNIGDGEGGLLNSVTLEGTGNELYISGDFYSPNTLNIGANNIETGDGGDFRLFEGQNLITKIFDKDGSALIPGQILGDPDGITEVQNGANVQFTFGLAPGQTPNVDDTIFVADGNSEDIGTVTISPLAFLTIVQDDNIDDLSFTVTAVKTFAAGVGPDFNALAGVLDGICADEDDLLQDVCNAMWGAGDEEGADAILATLNPAGPDGALTGSVLEIGEQVWGLAADEMAFLRTNGETTGMAAGASANGASIWGQGYGQTAQQDTRSGVKGYDSDTLGFAIGADSTNMIDGVLGLAFNYGKTNVNSKNANTTGADIDSYGVTLYGSHDLADQAFVNGQIGYAYNDIGTHRHNAGGAGLTANAGFSSDQYAAKLLLGRDYDQNGGLVLTPNVSAAYTNLRTDGYTETGTGTVLTVNSETFNVLKLGVGVNAAWDLKDNNGNKLKPALHVGYAYDTLGENVEETSSFVGGGGSFQTTGADPARNIFNAGAAMTYTTSANWDLSANYDYTYKADYDSHAGTIRATSHF